MTSRDLPEFDDLRAAERQIAGIALRTPLLESALLNARLGGRVLVKPEGLQPTGSFKLRGAVNRAANLTPDERRRGVVARSSGNHGQALAFAGGLFGVPVTVVVPDTAPQAKISKIAALGAKVIAVAPGDQARVADAIARDEAGSWCPRRMIFTSSPGTARPRSRPLKTASRWA